MVASSAFGVSAQVPVKNLDLSAANVSIDAPLPQGTAVAEQPGATANNTATGQAPATITGTVADGNGDLIPGATVSLEGVTPLDRRTATADGNGEFTFSGLQPGVPYHVRIRAPGFLEWDSPAVTLTSGQYLFLPGVHLKIEGGNTSVTVYSSPTQIAVEQVALEEQQRVLGLFPNFYVSYTSDATPLTAKLKYKLALRVSIDPITIAGMLAYTGIDQAANTPDFQQGMKGYGQRFGANVADGFTDIMFGGAILPSLLHQDPRYFYQGTGTVRSRLRHALASPFVCRGDNGHEQPNYSTIGGDLASSAISNLYYPQSNRSGQMVIENMLIGTAQRTASSVMQEFVLAKLTTGAKGRRQ